jgi:hypothetical protein
LGTNVTRQQQRRRRQIIGQRAETVFAEKKDCLP